MWKFLIIGLLAIASQAMAADQLPPNAVKYLPVLKSEIKRGWPELKLRSALAAQVEQETCISLKSAKCWNPNTELKTDREYGFGLGQLTKTAKFDAWKEVKSLDSGLASWKWEDRYDPQLQLRAVVAKDRFNVRQFKAAPDAFAFGIAAYNGGVGGALNDIAMCRGTRGCNPGLWFGNVEYTSHKSRTKWKGYGASAFEINRGYVCAILGEGTCGVNRRKKYIQSMDVMS